jgi:hypothetical protein
MEVRAQWERTWALQRREDAGETLPTPIPVPDKYDAKDYRDPNYFRLRGKLDVPKERFIAYPTATPPPGAGPKPGLVFGWAGWDHLQQLDAAVELWQHEWGLHGHEIVPRATRKDREETLGPAAASDEKLRLDTAARQRLMPLLQTMADLLPWVRQWHDEDGDTAHQFEVYVSDQARLLEVSLEDAARYRRPARTRAPDRDPRPPAPAASPTLLDVGPATRGKREPAPGTLDALVDAVRAADEGTGVAVTALGERMGLSAAALKKVVDALVEAGRLVERKKRPRVVSAV